MTRLWHLLYKEGKTRWLCCVHPIKTTEKYLVGRSSDMGVKLGLKCMMFSTPHHPFWNTRYIWILPILCSYIFLRLDTDYFPKHSQLPGIYSETISCKIRSEIVVPRNSNRSQSSNSHHLWQVPKTWFTFKPRYYKQVMLYS